MYKRGFLVLCFAVLTWWMFSSYRNFPEDGALGRRVLITGASSGIGEHLAYQYAKHGASVFITARREDRLKEVIAKCKELGQKNAKFGYLVADMKDYKIQTNNFIKAGVKHLGGIDTIIANHAFVNQFVIFWLGMEKDLDSFEKQVDINFKSYVYLVSYALPYLKKAKDGHISIIGSIAGKLPTPRTAIYNGVKFALDGFFTALRLELAQSNSGISVTYNVIGATDTDMFRENIDSFESLNNTLLSTLASYAKSGSSSPEDVAYQIMSATEYGASELDYPATAPVIPIPIRLFVVLRSIFPSFNLLSIPEEVYTQYEATQKK